MSNRPTQAQVEDTTASWSRFATHVAESLLPTLDHLRDSAPDGYTSSSLDGSGGHVAGGVSRPTENAVVARQRNTECARRVLRAYGQCEKALDHLSMELARAWPQRDELETMAEDAGGFCVNCVKYEVQSVRAPGRSGARCEPCRTYRDRKRRETGDASDRPRELVISHERRRALSYDRGHRRAGVAFGGGRV